MAESPAAFLQTFMEDFDRFDRLRGDVLERCGPDEYERSVEVKQGYESLGKRIALARKYVKATGASPDDVDLFFNDEHARRTRDALLTAIGAYECGLVEAQDAAAPRLRDQKFGILDAPVLLERDLPNAPGALGGAVIYLDVDHFKDVNTKYTERVVDKTVLPQFQRLVADATHGHGHAYAEGGDEVVVLLPNFSLAMAAAFAKDLVVLVRSTVFNVESEVVHLTISVGLAVASGGEELQALPDRANLAKKYSKEHGRNQVSLWTHSGCKPCSNMPDLAEEGSHRAQPKPVVTQPNYGTLDELWEDRERRMRRGR